MLVRLADWTAQASGSGPPDYTNTPFVPDEYVVTLEGGFSVSGAPSALAIEVWVTDGGANIIRATLDVDLTKTTIPQSIRVQGGVAYIGVVPVFTGGSAPAITGSVVAEQFMGRSFGGA